MVAKPSNNIQWNSTGSASNRLPTSGEQTGGHSAGTLLSRQLWNGLLNLIGNWQQWFDQSAFRADDFFSDQVLATGINAPSTGAGLGPVAAGDFAARVHTNGVAVGPIDSPAHTYTASRDTYWDLDDDGTWTAVEVPNGDPMPALTSNARRVFLVVTDATDRTSVTSYAPPWLDVVQQLRLAAPLLVGEFASGEDHTLLLGTNEHWSNPTGTTDPNTNASLPTRLYRSDAGAGHGGHCLELIANAVYSGGAGGTWSKDDTANASYMLQVGEGGLHLLYRAAGAGTWADNRTTGWTKVNEFAFGGHNGDFSVTGTLTSTGLATASDFAYASVASRRVSINAWAGGGNVTGTPSSGWSNLTPGVVYSTTDTVEWTIPLDAYVPDGAVLTGVTWYGQAGSGGNTNLYVGRLEKATGTVSYFKTGTTYDAFTNQGYVTAMAATLDAAFASSALNQTSYSYFVRIYADTGQNNTTIASVDVDYTVTKPK